MMRVARGAWRAARGALHATLRAKRATRHAPRMQPNDSLRRIRIVASVLDDAIRVPGTDIRFGIDPLVGLVPGLGDLVGGAASV